MKAFLAVSAWFAAAAVLVIGAVVALFRIDFLHQIPILFYRGLVLIAIGEALCFVVLWLGSLRWPFWRLRDVVSACAFSAGLALSLLIILPVTIDRSISVFLLTQMAAQPDRDFTSAELRKLFVEVYVARYEQVERRLDEQELSGNIAHDAAGFRITPQGLTFVRFARLLSAVFQTDPRFVSSAATSRSSSAGERSEH
ncbi:MAG TPA: hypothetical protein VKV77_01200 [Methylovirgula sp.]|nr:hypothetical protein [Methylovirgula sp.]